MIPLGFCQCGCGKETSIVRWTDRAEGVRKGQPRRYLLGHNTRIHINGAPMPLCACGCGQPVAPAAKTDRIAGKLKGVPLQYVRGHNDSHSEPPRPGQPERPLSRPMRAYVTAFERVLFARDLRDVAARCIDMARLAGWNSVPYQPVAPLHRAEVELPFDLLPNLAEYRTIREYLCSRH